MTGFARRGAVAAIALAMLLGPVSPARACSCAATSERALAAHADVIFVGTVTDVDEPGPVDAVLGSGDTVVATLRIHNVRKGRLRGRRARVRTPRSSASCGIEFEVGGRYRVYADRDRRRGLRTYLCGGTRRVAGKAAVAPCRGRPSPPGRRDRQ
jgi:hypothetical protein